VISLQRHQVSGADIPIRLDIMGTSDIFFMLITSSFMLVCIGAESGLCEW
jgi:hypothetical protein